MTKVSFYLVVHLRSKMLIVPLVLVVFWMSSVVCEICEITDYDDCTTEGANNSYGSFVNGIDDIVEASDPLRIDFFEDKQPTIHYKLTNASLSGMRDCDVTSLKIHKEALTFLFILECPVIVAKSNYDLKGDILTMHAEGKGVLTITADNYVLMFNGEYEKILGEDDKIYVQIKSHTLDIEPRGKVMFEMTNLFNGDKEKSDIVHKFLNRNWRIIDELFRSPSIDKFMDLFVQNINKFLKSRPVEKVLVRKNES